MRRSPGVTLFSGLLFVLAGIGFVAGFPVDNVRIGEMLADPLRALPVIGKSADFSLFVFNVLLLAAVVYATLVRYFDRAMSRAT